MNDTNYLSVTALTKYIKYKFDQDAHLKHVLLKGEISNFKHHSRGHFYFTLKDDHAQISAIMFSRSATKVQFRPEDGMSVLVEGYVSVYEQSGNYQIYVKTMSEDGLGNLHVAYEQLKKKLETEGLFNAEHKQPIPRFPTTIAVLTSPTGAAVRDIINIVNRRYPLAKIIVYPTLVQGEFAKDSIISQLKAVNKDGLADVIILGRGGGSIEDLWPFNEELVAYEIFASKVPIISSVGHETDFTISDFVADLRAPTPSGGAELAVPNQVDLQQQIRQMEDTVQKSLQRIIDSKNDLLRQMQEHILFRDPLRLLEPKSRRLDHLMDTLRLLHPGVKLEQAKKDVLQRRQSLHEYFHQFLKQQQSEYILLLNKLELINPLSIMKKGYSINTVGGQIITSINQVQQGDIMTVKVQDGQIETTVNHVRKDDDK